MQFMKSNARLALIVGLSVAVVAGLFAAPAVLRAETNQVAQSRDALNELSLAFNHVAEQTSPAVVFIEVEREMRGQRGRGGFPGGGDPRDFFERFFGPGGPQMPMPEAEEDPDAPGQMVPFGQGSGFIISPDGYILTNHHVVGEADIVNVTLGDGRSYIAETLGSDPQTEIALIKIDADNLPYLQMSNSDDLMIGQWVLAIGSPFGLTHSVTAGIVSARGRGMVGIVDYADFIQTDAAINPGNSGGPLLNLHGEVVGMNTAIVSRSGGNMGIGFAIPVNMIRYVEDQLRRTGTVTRGFLGVHIQNLPPELAQYYGLDRHRGVVIVEVQPDSPADRAGLRAEDVIIGYAGQIVTEAGSFRSRVASTLPGQEMNLRILRDGSEMQLSVTLGELEQDGEGVTRAPETNGYRLGLGVQALSAELAEEFGYVGAEGVVVTRVEPNSAAARANLRRGDLILEVERQTVSTPDEFRSVLDGTDKDSVLLRVRRGEGRMLTVLEVPRE